MHNATAITTSSATQRPNTPCIMLRIDVTFPGLEDSYRQKWRRRHRRGSCFIWNKKLTPLSN